MVTRRLMIAGGLAVVALGGGALLARAGLPAAIRAVLRRDLPHVTMSDGDVAALAADIDHVQGLSTRIRAGARLLDVADVVASPGLSWRILRHIFRTTDFFDDPDTPRRIAYVASADPYLSGYANRLARFDED